MGAGVDGVCSPTARPQLWPPLSRQIQCAGEAKRTSHGRPGALQLATGHLPLRRPWRRCNPGAHTAHIRARRLRAQTRPRVRTRNIHLSAPWPLDSRVSSSSRTSGCGSLSASQSESPRSTWHSRIGGRPGHPPRRVLYCRTRRSARPCVKASACWLLPSLPCPTSDGPPAAAVSLQLLLSNLDACRTVRDPRTVHGILHVGPQ